MRIIAIDTGSAALSLALADEHGVVAEAGLNNGRQHSLTLLPMLDALLANAGWSLRQADALALTIGPGSFTGLRIGVATAKAWAQGVGLPLIAVSSLQAMALTAAESGLSVCPVFDARRDEVYWALFDGENRRLSEDAALAPAALAERLAALRQPVVMAGDALDKYAPLFAAALGDDFRPAPPQRRLFMASAAALLGADKYARGEFSEAASLQPVYLRLSEAEEKKLAREAAADGR
ncbi:MAG: tRNA (adenosine(37)-N6)-threonylcarbamoyltransferase complex dimerization subunit type 1 TsaB [Bacillota bacterium]|nr:tRNA (adenosine(37)-N6)-threonylcarbamoyltransferase complex dimerization subunit type 1 TsaB [Bacillota bacterium]